LFRSTGVSQADVAQFTQQLATLVGAGLPLDRSLLVLAELAETPRLKRLVDRIRDEVRGGVSLSEALERQHGVFSRLYVNMVRAGELGGTLDHTLSRLALYLERNQELKSSVVSALIYPCILLLLAGGALIFLLVFVIPNFMPLFEQLGGELPLITQIVLAFANLVRYGWLGLPAGAAGIAIFFQRQFRDPVTRLVWDTRLLNLQVGGRSAAPRSRPRVWRARSAPAAERRAAAEWRCRSPRTCSGTPCSAAAVEAAANGREDRLRPGLRTRRQQAVPAAGPADDRGGRGNRRARRHADEAWRIPTTPTSAIRSSACLRPWCRC
jgi:hypothetical protein